MRQSSTPFVPQFEQPIDLKRTIREEWVESAATFAHDERTTAFLGTSISRRSISWAFVCMTIVLAGFFLQSAYLQVFEGRVFARASTAQRENEEVVPARRGIVVDSTGAILVHNVPRFTLEVLPAELPRNPDVRAQIIDRASALAGMTAEKLTGMVKDYHRYEPLVIKDAIPYPGVLSLMLEVDDLKGVAVEQRYARQYQFDGAGSLSHVIGYLGGITEEEYQRSNGAYRRSDARGRDGVELSYEDSLRGRDGVRRIEVDALGREKRVVSEEIPRDGSSLSLTIDRALQKKSEESLTEWMKKFNAPGGVVIVSDAKTGALLSLVSLPTYDDNAFAKGMTADEYEQVITDTTRPLFNRAVQGEYPSGSTIKPVVAAAALQEGVITPETSFISTGGIRILRWFFPDWKAGGHGRTNLKKALAESVNTYFYLIAGGSPTVTGLGIERLTDYFHRFGLGAKTGIDLHGEASGFIPSPQWKEEKKGEQWYIGDTYHVAIGQGDILVTPLQVHAYTAYFANSGIAYVPHIVQGNDSRVLLSGVIDTAHIASIREGMRSAVLDGSARRLTLLPVSAAGKTGTAQWNSTKKPHAWFTGWAPYENPAVVITVLVEEGEEGSKSAIRVAHDVLSWYFSQSHTTP